MGNTVSIINPSPISREGLRRILDDGGISVVATAASIDELATLVPCFDHLLLIDMPTPEEQVDMLRCLLDKEESAKAVILVEQFDMATMMNCFAGGAHGYAVKNIPIANLLALLQLAALGHKIMPSDLADILKLEDIRFKNASTDIELDASEANLSLREHEVLCCLMAGYSNKRIARLLMVSEATIKVHVKAILRKLNVINRTQAAMWATARGLAASSAHIPISIAGTVHAVPDGRAIKMVGP